MPRRHAVAAFPQIVLAVLCAAPHLQARTAQETPLGSASAITPEPVAVTVRVPAGSELLGAPDARAARLTLIDFDVDLPVIERRGAWVRVEFAGSHGWLALAESDTTPEPDGRTPPSPGSADGPGLAGRRSTAAPERIERARRLLGPGATTQKLGAFTLHTASGKIALIDRLRRVATALPDAYAQRTGLTPQAEAGFAVVLFATEEEYRRYAESDLVSSLALAGHAKDGVAALYLGSRNAGVLLPLAIHEMAHLLNRTTLGERVPSWLEEGLANDLAYCRTDRSGRLQLGSLSGTEFSSVARGQRETVYLEGPVASLSFLRQRSLEQELLPFSILLDLAWSEFVDPEGRDLRYVESSFLVRYLFDGRGEQGAERFRAYLQRIAGGNGGDPRALLDTLGVEWSALERGFRSWLEAQAIRR